MDTDGGRGESEGHKRQVKTGRGQTESRRKAGGGRREETGRLVKAHLCS